MKTLALAIFILSLGLVTGCQKKAETTIQFQIPSAQELRGKVNSQSTTIDPTLLCFGVNVRGGNVPRVIHESCTLDRGISAGSVAPAAASTTTVGVQVPVSSDLTFEIYGFLRASAGATCPDIREGSWNWPADKTYLLGRTTNVTVEPSTEFVDVTISYPQPGANIAAPCLASNNIGRTALSATVSSGSLFKAYSRVSEKNENQILSGSQFQIHNWKASVH